jgi:2,3-bisphosphoglycerate-independent phosphoglycerate mutase
MSVEPGPGVPPVPSVCLVILDGWGLAPPGPGNAVELAETPVFDALWSSYPHTRLTACGRAVGLPDGQMGNSEVGHLNLGAGQIVRQDLTRIDDAIADGSFARNEVLRTACAAGRESGRLHLLGLVSGGGVHASMDHLRACIELAASEGVPDVVLHAFTDGRDTLPDSGAGYLATTEGWLREHGGRVATVGGRYYAMDRDRRWERTKLAYDAIVHGRSAPLGLDPDDASGAGATPRVESGEAAVHAAYGRGETDEFVRPTLVGEEGRIRDGDAVLFFNFRPDRARQLTRALADPDFAELDRAQASRARPPAELDVAEPDDGRAPRVRLTTLTEYQEDWSYPVAFPPERPRATLASVLAERDVRQLHVAETEKYAHVTYFFNGGEEHEHPGERRCLVDSPRDVPTYDHKPEMSAPAAASAFVERWARDGYGFGIINFANPDMVGHTGVIPAAVKAVETVDEQLGRVVEAVHAAGGACIVTADHGNADNMLEPDGSPNTAHSLNPVPLIVTADVGGLREGGILADVAPTVLDLLGQPRPVEMTGTSLLARPAGNGR